MLLSPTRLLTPDTRLPTRRWPAPVVVVVVSSVCALLVWRQGGPWYDWVGVAVCLEFAAVWALLRTDPVLAPNARCCLAAALLVVANNVGFDHNGPAWVVNVGLRTVSAVPFGILLLRYPYPRLTEPLDRAFVLVATGWTVAGQLLVEVVWTPPAGYHEWWPTLVRGNHLSWVETAVDLSDLVLLAVGLVLVARRPLRARGLDRRELWPVAVAGAGVAVGAAGTVVGYTFVHGGWASVLAPASAFAYLFIPVSFLVVALQRRLARARLVELTAAIGAVIPAQGPAGLRAALRRALADPALDVLYWVDGGYVDEDGLAATLEPAGRLIVPVAAHDGSRLAALVGDAGLERHRDMVDAVVTSARLALENARLQAALLAQLTQIRSAQHRIVEAGLAERRRIERDLHDGAQQRLLVASMTLARAGESAEPDALIAQAREQLQLALGELRDLARGIHPAVLSQSGLAAASESLVEHAAVPVLLDVPATRWGAAVESAAYFVIAECLANAGKHAPGSRVSIVVHEEAGGVVVRVSDDGPGGAAFAVGGGLAGLADRVRALGGSFALDSAAEHGTSVTAVIPCG